MLWLIPWESKEWICWIPGAETALDMRDASNFTRILDEDQKGPHLVSTPGGDQSMANPDDDQGSHQP